MRRRNARTNWSRLASYPKGKYTSNNYLDLVREDYVGRIDLKIRHKAERLDPRVLKFDFTRTVS